MSQYIVICQFDLWPIKKSCGRINRIGPFMHDQGKEFLVWISHDSCFFLSSFWSIQKVALISPNCSSGEKKRARGDTFRVGIEPHPK